MPEFSQTLEAKQCPLNHEHFYARVTREVLNGMTVITKECSTCGQFISQTTLPVERLTKQ